MKRIFRKNQVIITSLVIMIIIAGYLNFTADKVTTTQDGTDVNTVTQNVDDLGNITEAQVSDGDALVDVDVAPEEDLSQVMEDGGDALASQDGEDIGDVSEIGEAVLTSTNSSAAVNFCSAPRGCPENRPVPKTKKRSSRSLTMKTWPRTLGSRRAAI